jgi:lipopolysaccharide transport system ATP-binding protein
MQPIIEVKNLSKSYKIRHETASYLTLRDILADTLRHPLKFLKKKAKQVAGIDKEETFWALKGVDFDVAPGETLGIIGANGSGKSTLLKILSQITPPTTGEIKIRGKMTSLLEVGTGFHPELTGRENIFLNGAIMGMSKKEISKKFDEIVSFAGVEKFLDTQVKHYSSGMYVRLAFAVAAHMEPDILIIDEVLAVGDAEFQKKCLGKMEEVTQKEGRTILFVSHNMSAIQSLCKKSLLLNKGEIVTIGETEKVIEKYLESNKNMESVMEYKIKENLDVQITKISILNNKKNAQSQIPLNENFSIEIDYVVRQYTENAIMTINFYAGDYMFFLSTETDKNPSLKNYEQGSYKTIVEIPSHLFNVGQYFFDITIQRPFIDYLDIVKGISFEISDITGGRSSLFKGKNIGKLAIALDYKTKKMT